MASSALLERGSSAVAPFAGPDPGLAARLDPGRFAGERQLVRAAALHGRIRKDADGCKIHCRCDDEVARGTLQNLCRMLSDGLCSCCCTWNGISCCQCNFTLGICKCEYTKDGCCITCTSGDKACCAMIQACCDCLQHLLRKRLLLLHLLQQHAGLLRHVCVIVAASQHLKKSTRVSGIQCRGLVSFLLSSTVRRRW